MSVDEMFAAKVTDRGDPRPRLALPHPTVDAASAWKLFPKVQAGFKTCISTLAAQCGVKPSYRLDGNARAYLRQAEGFFNDDEAEDRAELVASLVHLLLIPRIECEGKPALPSLKALRDAVSPKLPAAHDVLQQVDLLIKDAEAGRDLRGLRS